MDHSQNHQRRQDLLMRFVVVDWLVLRRPSFVVVVLLKLPLPATVALVFCVDVEKEKLPSIFNQEQVQPRSFSQHTVFVYV